MAQHIAVRVPWHRSGVGSITDIFKDRMGTAKDILDLVDKIKQNSETIAL